MTVVSGLRLSAAVAATGTNGSGVFYTVPANSYAIVNITIRSTGANDAQLRINGSGGVTSIIPIVTAGTESYPAVSATPVINPIQTVYLGPAQTLETVNNSGSTLTISVTGVLFTNG